MTRAYIAYTTVKQDNDRKAELIENIYLRLQYEKPVPLEWITEYNKLIKEDLNESARSCGYSYYDGH